MVFNYFKADYAIKIHDKIIEISGGRAGLKDYGNIDSPLTHIQNDDYYSTFEEKLTHLVFSFKKFHAFNDGNKRTSIAMGAFFLEVNGLDVFVNKFRNCLSFIDLKIYRVRSRVNYTEIRVVKSLIRCIALT